MHFFSGSGQMTLTSCPLLTNVLIKLYAAREVPLLASPKTSQTIVIFIFTSTSIKTIRRKDL